MKLIVIRHLWGLEGTWEEEFPRIKQAGYDGIETAVPPAEQIPRFRDLLVKFGFEFVPMVSTHGPTAAEHIEAYKRLADAAAPFKPRLLSCHTGRDFWEDDETARFYEQTLRVDEKNGFCGAHETHRYRPFYNPWTTLRMLKRFDKLQLVCDFSHWVVVCERLLEDCDESIRAAAAHCIHLHTRVGFHEGPQVPDPRAPEYAKELAAHEAWWDIVWEAQRARGLKEVTLTPEFGPPRYLHTLPYTQAPVTDLRAVCDWMAGRQRERFQKRFGS